jgi:hypothetical protein
MTSLFVDLHNPLHVAYVGDSGGENCDLSLKSTSDLDDTTLRDLWDTNIVETILSPSQFDNQSVVNGVVNALHSFIQENIQEIENDGALNAFEDIFTHETYADMIEVWMMYVVYRTLSYCDENSSTQITTKKKRNNTGTHITSRDCAMSLMERLNLLRVNLAKQ